jgi:hypothetical protein
MMDKLFWSIWKRRVEENNVTIRKTTDEMDTEEIQNHFH